MLCPGQIPLLIPLSIPFPFVLHQNPSPPCINSGPGVLPQKNFLKFECSYVHLAQDHLLIKINYIYDYALRNS
jgi:hypothetical protein